MCSHLVMHWVPGAQRLWWGEGGERGKGHEGDAGVVGERERDPGERERVDGGRDREHKEGGGRNNKRKKKTQTRSGGWGGGQEEKVKE